MAVGEAFAINASAGAPAYTAGEARRILAALQAQGQADRVGAREGIRPGSTAVSLASTTVTVHDHVGVVYPGLTATSGPYLYEMAEGTHTLDPADGTNDRIDAIDIQIQDQDEDASGQRRVRSVYVVGTPAATPSEPALTANAFRAATIDVPADGTGSPSLTYVAPWAVASGGVLPVRDTTELPSAGEYDGLMAWQQDEQFLLANIGGTFVNVRHEEARARASDATARSLGGVEATVLLVDLSIPAHWNSWDVEYGFTFDWRSASAASPETLSVRVRHGSLSGTVLSTVPQHEMSNTTPDKAIITMTGGAAGLTGTGTQGIRCTAHLGSAASYDATERQGWARAVRVS